MAVKTANVEMRLQLVQDHRIFVLVQTSDSYSDDKVGSHGRRERKAVVKPFRDDLDDIVTAAGY